MPDSLALHGYSSETRSVLRKNKKTLLENNSEMLHGCLNLDQAFRAQQALAVELLGDRHRRMDDFEPMPNPDQMSKAKKKKKKSKKKATTMAVRNQKAVAVSQATQQNDQNNVATAQPTVPITRSSAQPEPIIVVPPKTTIYTQKKTYSLIAQLDEHDPKVIELRNVQKRRQQDINDFNYNVMDEPGTRILRNIDGQPVLPSKDFRRRGTSERKQMRSAGY
jgi:hypothetical protein